MEQHSHYSGLRDKDAVEMHVRAQNLRPIIFYSAEVKVRAKKPFVKCSKWYVICQLKEQRAERTKNFLPTIFHKKL